MNLPKHVMQVFVIWARKKGIKKPNTQAAMNILFAQFLAEQPAWDEVATGEAPVQMTWDGVSEHIVDRRIEPADDFDELQERREAAMAEADGDDLARDVILGRQDAERIRRAVTPVLTNPMSAKDGPLGGVATPNATGPNGIEVARWAGEDIEATNFVITAGPVWEAGTAQPTSITQRTFLQVMWGTRSQMQYLEVDVGKGCEFTLAGSYVTVAVACEASVANNNAQPINASVAFRQGNRTAMLTRTKTFTGINGAQVVNVPPFAKRVTLLVSNPAASGRVQMFEPDGTLLEDFTQAAASSPGVYTLPASAATLTITTGALSNFSCVFELGV